MVLRDPRHHGCPADGRGGRVGQRRAPCGHDPQRGRRDDRDPTLDRLPACAPQADADFHLRLWPGGRFCRHRNRPDHSLQRDRRRLRVHRSPDPPQADCKSRMGHPRRYHRLYRKRGGCRAPHPGRSRDEQRGPRRRRLSRPGRRIDEPCGRARRRGRVARLSARGPDRRSADPVAIFGIVWQSARAVLTRMLDGVEPGVLAEIRHAAEHVPGLKQIHDVTARWRGHRLHADVTIGVDPSASLGEATAIADAFKRELSSHMPALAAANVVFTTGTTAGMRNVDATDGHHHAPDPFKVSCGLAEGLLEIVDTPAGERMRLTMSRPAPGLLATVNIKRSAGTEYLPLAPAADYDGIYESAVAPAEPHEFEADLSLTDGTRRMVLPFRMVEPPGHHH